ncbi:imelysin family protein, partial [Synechococcus sp. OH20]
MSRYLKLWTGIGLYVLVSGAACGESQKDPPALSQASPQQAAQMNPECRPIPVDGGGEGGEGGEEGAGSGRPAVVLSPEQRFQDRQILIDFADQVVIPAYEQLAADTQALSQAIQAFVQDPNSQTLQAARQAWSVARLTWEESEAFAFGPAASLGLDADLDEWPLNEVEVLEVLNSGDPLTPETVAELESGQKGFHAVAFLLFGVDNNKSLQDFTERDREYLAA